MGATIEDFVKATVTVTSGSDITFNPNSIAILTSEAPLNYTPDYMLTTRRDEQIVDAFGEQSHVTKVFRAIARQTPSALDYNGDVTVVAGNIDSGEVPQTIYSKLLDGRNRDGWKKGTLSFNFTNSGVESYTIDLTNAQEYSDVATEIENTIRSGEAEEDTATVYLTSVGNIDGILSGNEFLIAANLKTKTGDPAFTLSAPLNEDWTFTVDGVDIDVSLPTADGIDTVDKLASAINKAFVTDGRGFTANTDVEGHALTITYPLTIDPTAQRLALVTTPKASGKTSIFSLMPRTGMNATITITPQSGKGATTVTPKAGDTPFSIISDIAGNLPSGFSADLKTNEVVLSSATPFAITIDTLFMTGDTSNTDTINSIQTSAGAKAMPTVNVLFDNQRLQFTFDKTNEVTADGISGTLAPVLGLDKGTIFQAPYTKSRETLADMLKRLLAKKTVAGVCIAVPETDAMRKNTNVFLAELTDLVASVQLQDLVMVFCSDNRTIISQAGTNSQLQFLVQDNAKGIFYIGQNNVDEVAGAYLGKLFGIDFSGYASDTTMNGKRLEGISPSTEYSSIPADSLKLKQQAHKVGIDTYEAVNGVDPRIQSMGIGGIYADTKRNMQYMKRQLEYALYLVLTSTPTKIPQTPDGMSVFYTAVEQQMVNFRNAGFIAGGLKWSGQRPFPVANFEDQYLQSGYVIYIENIADQSKADRQDRKASKIHIVAQLSGAIHMLQINLSVEL